MINAVDQSKVSQAAKLQFRNDLSELLPRTAGIATRVQEEQGINVLPGEGWSGRQATEEGQRAIAQGLDPEARMEELRNQGEHPAISAIDMAAFKAHYADLRKAVLRAAGAGDKAGYEAAMAKALAWADRVKPLQTQWQKIGAAQQGEIDLDTGDFYGLQYDFITRVGRDWTEDEAAHARELVAKTNEVDSTIATKKDAMEKGIQEEAKKPEPKEQQTRKAAKAEKKKTSIIE
jgi:hypothetical protein